MAPERRLTAERVVADVPSPAVLNVATVTRHAEPRISALDGHFLHGRWYFTTAGDSPKVVHIKSRPAVSASYTPRDGYGIFCHGDARVELPHEIGVRRAKRLLQRKVVRIKSEEQQGWNQGNERKVRLSLICDDNKNGRDNGDAPRFA